MLLQSGHNYNMSLHFNGKIISEVLVELIGIYYGLLVVAVRWNRGFIQGFSMTDNEQKMKYFSALLQAILKLVNRQHFNP